MRLLLTSPARSPINHRQIDYYVIIRRRGDIIWGSLVASEEMVFLLVSTQMEGLRGSAEGMPHLLSPFTFLWEKQSQQEWALLPGSGGWDVADAQILSLFSTV